MKNKNLPLSSFQAFPCSSTFLDCQIWYFSRLQILTLSSKPESGPSATEGNGQIRLFRIILCTSSRTFVNISEFKTYFKSLLDLIFVKSILLTVTFLENCLIRQTSGCILQKFINILIYLKPCFVLMN